MKSIHLLIWARPAVMLLMVFCGPSLLASTPTASLENEEMKRRIVDLQQKATVAEVEIRRLRQLVAELEQRLSALEQRPAVARPAESLGRIESLERAESPERIDRWQESSARSLDDGLSTDSAERIEVDDLKVSDLDPPARPDSAEESPEQQSTTEKPTPTPPLAGEPGRPSPGDATAAAARPAEPLTSEAQALYDSAYAAFHQKRYAEAEARFESFLADHARSDLGDNAQFWIGECRYARGEYARALEAFTATVELYPQGNKVSDALLKAGKSLEALADDERARQTYREVITRFPGSAAAALASEHLAAIDRIE